jgi:hypothetical protein
MQIISRSNERFIAIESDNGASKAGFAKLAHSSPNRMTVYRVLRIKHFHNSTTHFIALFPPSVSEAGKKLLTAGFEPAIPGGLVFKTSALPGYATSAYERSE